MFLPSLSFVTLGEIGTQPKRLIVSVAQLRRWVDGVAVSPDETLKKRRLKALLA